MPLRPCGSLALPRPLSAVIGRAHRSRSSTPEVFIVLNLSYLFGLGGCHQSPIAAVKAMQAIPEVFRLRAPAGLTEGGGNFPQDYTPDNTSAVIHHPPQSR